MPGLLFVSTGHRLAAGESPAQAEKAHESRRCRVLQSLVFSLAFQTCSDLIDKHNV